LAGSNIILSPDNFQMCHISFSPNTVSTTSNMMITLTPSNIINQLGSIVVQFPINRKWTNDISTANLVFAANMNCGKNS